MMDIEDTHDTYRVDGTFTAPTTGMYAINAEIISSNCDLQYTIRAEKFKPMWRTIHNPKYHWFTPWRKRYIDVICGGVCETIPSENSVFMEKDDYVILRDCEYVARTK